MFSMTRRWFMANQSGLLKGRGPRKGQNRFWPVAVGQNWQKLAGCSSLPLPLSFPLPLPCTCACARARAHCCAQSALHLSRSLCLNFIMLSLSPHLPPLFFLQIYSMQQSTYYLQLSMDLIIP